MNNKHLLASWGVTAMALIVQSKCIHPAGWPVAETSQIDAVKSVKKAYSAAPVWQAVVFCTPW